MACKESKSTQNHNCLFTLAHSVLVDVPSQKRPFLTGVEVFRVGLVVGVVLFWVSMTKVGRVHRK